MLREPSVVSATRLVNSGSKAGWPPAPLHGGAPAPGNTDEAEPHVCFLLVDTGQGGQRAGISFLPRAVQRAVVRQERGT